MKAPEGLAGLAAREAGHVETLRASWMYEVPELEANRERAAVVSWLRQLAESCDTEAGTQSLLEAAGDIERGEHREEKP